MTEPYADYAYYTGVYLGTLVSSSDFPSLVSRASVTLDRLSFNRVAPVIDDGTDLDTIDSIMRATCAMVDELQNINASGQATGPITSESLGGYSVSYAEGSPATLPAIHRLRQVADLYLSETGLLYPGFNAWEGGTRPTYDY